MASNNRKKFRCQKKEEVICSLACALVFCPNMLKFQEGCISLPHDRRTGSVSFAEAEVSCPNIFSMLAPNLHYFCPKWLLVFQNSRGYSPSPRLVRICPPPPPPRLVYIRLLCLSLYSISHSVSPFEF